MKFVIENNCYNSEAVEMVNPYFQPFIDKLLSKAELNSLDYFVVADSHDDNYANSIQKYAVLVGTEVHITQDESYLVAGKALDGIDSDGKLHQAIVIKSSVWVCAAYEYMLSQGLLKEDVKKQMNTPPYMSLALILHEIGHVVDGAIQYRIWGTVNTKIAYDLRYEYNEYVTQTALSLWGEYFAESFAYQTIRCEEDLTLEKESKLIDCILNYSLNKNSELERAYRILYFFVQRIAFVHQQSNFHRVFNYEKLEENEVTMIYIPLLARTEMAIANLFRTYPNWDADKELVEFSEVFKDFVEFEHKRQVDC